MSPAYCSNEGAGSIQHATALSCIPVAQLPIIINEMCGRSFSYISYHIQRCPFQCDNGHGSNLLRLYRLADNMPSFFLSPHLSDADWDPLFVVDIHAFQNNPEVLALSPGGLSPAHRERNVAGFQHSVFGGPIERAYAKITEATSQEITSFISARVYRGAQGVVDGDLRAEPAPIKLPQIEDAEERRFYEAYWNSNLAVLRSSKEMQVPHVFIQALGTDPAWQGKGAATILVNWLLAFTAEQKLGRCVLQASPTAMGLGFYEKFGFRAVKTTRFVDERGRESTPVVMMVKDF